MAAEARERDLMKNVETERGLRVNAEERERRLVALLKQHDIQYL